MLATLITVAAQAVAEEAEASKTPFYVMGGILALWAVLVGALGISKHDFPGSQTVARGVMGISALLVVATMASSILTS